VVHEAQGSENGMRDYLKQAHHPTKHGRLRNRPSQLTDN
jgi:hypothetical protein